MTPAVARTLSILGHPLLVLPIAALLATGSSGGASPRPVYVAVGFGVLAVLIQGWSWWQVHRGRWRHVDASERAERHTLNLALLVLLPVAALLCREVFPEAAIGLLCVAAIVAVGVALRRWMKLSLHAACAVFAAALMLRVEYNAFIYAMVFAFLVCWSRRVLKRHTDAEVSVGAAAGIVAGVVFWNVV